MIKMNNNKKLRLQGILDCLPRKNTRHYLYSESPVSIKESPDFSNGQIKYLRKLIANTHISIFSNTITEMCSRETLQNAYDKICALEDEMINRKIIDNDNTDLNDECDSVFKIGFRFGFK